MSGRGTSPGTGVPLSFCCAKCRRHPGWWDLRGSRRQPGWRFVRTGRERRLYGRAASRRPPRSSDRQREYRCLDCGHVGWSRHSDLERAEVQK